MTTLQQVAKEDLEDGRNYTYEDSPGSMLQCARILEGRAYCVGDVHGVGSLISHMDGQFYGPIEIETE